MERDRAFVSYSHRDRAWLDRLLEHMAALERWQLVKTWSDRRIELGADWEQEITEALADAEFAAFVYELAGVLGRLPMEAAVQEREGQGHRAASAAGPLTYPGRGTTTRIVGRRAGTSEVVFRELGPGSDVTTGAFQPERGGEYRGLIRGFRATGRTWKGSYLNADGRELGPFLLQEVRPVSPR